VDIGVHQDGLVHISQLSDRFTDDPRTIVKTGDVVRVRVVDVDVLRKRIALSMKTYVDKHEQANRPVIEVKEIKEVTARQQKNAVKTSPVVESAFANALKKAFKN
jgi:uncharacterized protein